MGRQFSEYLYDRVIAMRNGRYKQKDIAKFFGISQGTVSKIMKRNRDTGRPTPRQRSGRPRKTTAREDRSLLRLCRNDRMKPASRLRMEWVRHRNVPVTRKLVNNRLFKAGLPARRPLRKPNLLPRHRRARLQWVRRHRNWHVAHWEHVIFSDEVRFLLYRQDGRIKVRRQVGEALREDCILPRVQGGGGGVTFWGAFHSRRKCELYVLDGHMNQDQYIHVLDTVLLPFARQDFRANFVYQDDNATAHRARRVVQFLDNENVERMEWPALSPDMNPIENLWADMSRMLGDMDNQPTNLAELTQAVIACWRDIPQETLRHYVEGMPRRVRALQLARGGHTKY